MNKLHLQYLRDTGQSPTIDLWNLYLSDNSMNVELAEAVEKWLEEKTGVSIVYTPEYIQWLEEQLNNKT